MICVLKKYNTGLTTKYIVTQRTTLVLYTLAGVPRAARGISIFFILAYLTIVVATDSLKNCQPIWYSRLASYS